MLKKQLSCMQYLSIFILGFGVAFIHLSEYHAQSKKKDEIVDSEQNQNQMLGLIAVLIYKENITRMQKFYLGLGFVGIYLVSFGLNNFLNDLNIGALLALIASISYGFAANIVQPLIKDYGAIPTLKISLRYATLFSFIMLLPNSDIVLPSISDSLFPILLLGIGSSGIAFVSF